MSGISKPNIQGLKSEVNFKIIGLNANSGSGGTVDKCGLFDGNTPNSYTTADTFYWNTANDYIELFIQRKCNIWRCGTASWNSYTNQLKIKKKNEDGTYTDVTSTYSIACTQIDNTKWEKFIHDLPRGQYRFEYTGGRIDSEWYLERASNDYSLVLTNNGKVRTFNKNNIWADTAYTLESLTIDNFIKDGFNPDILNTPLNTMYSNFNNCGVLDEADGGVLWITDDIDKNLGVTAMDLEDDEEHPRLILTIPTFLPKDAIQSTDKILFYTDEDNFYPRFDDIKFSSDTIHNGNIDIIIKSTYIWDKNLKYRIKVGDAFTSEWSSSQISYNDIKFVLPSAKLQLGDNDIVLELTNEKGDLLSSKLISKAITLTDTPAKLVIINTDSDSFKLHFTITDEDLGDNVQYKLTLQNTKVGEEVLVPWTILQTPPADVIYTFDTSKIVVNENNTIKIEYKDNLEQGGYALYSFTGEYKNLMFIDEHGSYYTTDKGVLLQLLQFDTIIGGQVSDAKKVTLKNQNDFPVKNVILSSKDLTGLKDLIIELSKSLNPFNPTTLLEYGDEGMNINDTKDFYVRVKTSANTVGIDNFEIDVNAEPA